MLDEVAAAGQAELMRGVPVVLLPGDHHEAAADVGPVLLALEVALRAVLGDRPHRRGALVEDGRQDVGEPTDVGHRRAGVLPFPQAEDDAAAVDLLLVESAVEQLVAHVVEEDLAVEAYRHAHLRNRKYAPVMSTTPTMITTMMAVSLSIRASRHTSSSGDRSAPAGLRPRS